MNLQPQPDTSMRFLFLFLLFAPVLACAQDLVFNKELKNKKDEIFSSMRSSKYPLIEKKIAINSKPTYDQLNDSSNPTEQEKIELRAWFDAFHNGGITEANAIKLLGESDKYKAYQSITNEYSEYRKRSRAQYREQFERLIGGGINYAEFNKFDARQMILDDKASSEFNAEITKIHRREYGRLLTCIGGLGVSTDDRLKHVDRLEFSRLATTDYCLQFHNPASFEKVLERFVDDSAGHLNFSSVAGGFSVRCAGVAGFLTFRINNKGPRCNELMSQLERDWKQAHNDERELRRRNQELDQRMRSTLH